MPKVRRGLTTTPTLRDEEIFLFLWKWKVATLKTLAHVFFAETSPIVAYHRLSKLRYAGYLTQRMDESGRLRVWTLDRKGFAALTNRLPELDEYGFASENIEHDLIVNALHLGDWARKAPAGVDVFTEQQLRRLKPEMYPPWVPQSKNHRPDGYWHISSGDHKLTVALEVELSAKSKERYVSVARFYEHYDSIDLVLWLVSSAQLGKKILNACTGLNFYRPNVHNFICLEEFQNRFWNSLIFSGSHKGSSIHDLLRQNLMQTLIQRPVKTSEAAMSSHLLDTSINSQNHSRNAKFNLRNFPD